MKKSRKIISLLLSLIMALSIFTIVPFTAGASEADKAATGQVDPAYPDFEYEDSYDNGVMITKYNGSAEDLTIPSYLGGKEVLAIDDYAFKYNETLVNVTIPSTVKRIYNMAFFSCDALESVVIGESVEYIGRAAFGFCDLLRDVTFPDSITYIHHEAFEYTKWYDDLPIGPVYIGNALYLYHGEDPASLEIKDGTTFILDGALEDRRGIESVIIPDSVTSIGDWAFRNCEGLTEIVIPDSVTSIGQSAFEGCTNLSDITFSANCTHYGYEAFSDTAWCDAQPDGILYAGDIAFDVKNELPEKVIIKEGTKRLVDGLFGGHEEISEVVMPDSVENIGDEVFYNCGSLYSITFGKNLKYIGDNVFYQCNRLYNVYIKDLRGWCELEFTDGFSNPMCFAPNLYLNDELITDLVIPDGITKVGDYQFWYCLRFKTVTIPDSVTSIGVSAFQCLDELETIDIPNSVKTIGDKAFFFSENLKSVSIPASVTRIGEKAFNYCDSLETITIDGSNPVYDSRDNCNAIIETGTNTLICGCKSTVIPASVTAIGDSAFYACKRTEMVIPDSIKTIGKEAFAWSENLRTLSIGNSVTDIGDMAFSFCNNMSNVTIGNSVTSIGDSAFNGCKGLTSINIPDSVKTIGAGAFSGCAFKTLDIPRSVTDIGERAFSNCRNLIEVTIPDSITKISDNAFIFCTSLMSVTIPDSVTSIEEEAFRHCTSLKSVTIPDSVTSIGKNAFGYTYGDSYWDEPKIDGFTIYGHKGTAAEAYANENGFRFSDPLVTKTDEDTHVTISVPADTEIKAEKLTESAAIADIKAKLPEPSEIISVYDIILTKDNEAVQPETATQVKIPCENENAIVYRSEDDGTFTDMNAVYRNGCMVFYTDHFSIYVLAETVEITGVTVSGAITSYLDDSDVTVKLTGVDNNFTAETTGKTDYSIAEVPAGEYTLTVSKANHVTAEYTVTVADTDVTQDVEVYPLGDVTGDGKTNVQDCTAILRYVRKLDTLSDDQLKIGDVTGDGKVNVQDVTRILRHVRKIEALY